MDLLAKNVDTIKKLSRVTYGLIMILFMYTDNTLTIDNITYTLLISSFTFLLLSDIYRRHQLYNIANLNTCNEISN